MSLSELGVLWQVFSHSRLGLIIAMGRCFTWSSISQVTPVNGTLKVFAMSHTVLPDPEPLDRLAILAISMASSVIILEPTTASGVALFSNLRNLPVA